MTKNYLEFPRGFLWGAATAAHQVEGGNIHNDWWDFEQRGKINDGEISGEAVDHYHRYQEDFSIARRLHHNIHRFSVEWSRIEPREGEFDRNEIDHYLRVIQALRAEKMKVMVTLFHFTLPLWLAKIGGWENGQAAEYFARFVDYVARSLKGQADYWVTINEPMVYAYQSYINGTFPAQKKNVFSFFKVAKTLMRAHKKAYSAIHAVDPRSVVGVSQNLIFYEPSNPRFFLDRFLSRFMTWLSNDWFLDETQTHLDYIGVQYYFHTQVTASVLQRFLKVFKLGANYQDIAGTLYAGVENKSDLGWEIYPWGLYEVLLQLKKYDLPVIITENGVADRQDLVRQEFIQEHLKSVHRAISEGVDVRGYIYWTLMDNFEWNIGRQARFGLVEIDYEHGLTRKIRPSALFFADICQHNRLELVSEKSL